MNISTVKTRIVQVDQISLTNLLEESVKTLSERSVVAITSKVVSLCEANVLPLDSCTKEEIIEREADFFLPKITNRYGVYLTIKNDMLIPSAGVDESNTGGYYVMWPKNAQDTANKCYIFLKNKFELDELGVIITDSTSSPLRPGVTGKCIVHCGFAAVNSQIGQPDLFGRRLESTHVNVADSLASAAVLCMGESNEQTPICVIGDLPFVDFKTTVPSVADINALRISPENDLFAALLTTVDWKKGKK